MAVRRGGAGPGAGKLVRRRKPTMFLLVGANGAGKSTLYEGTIKPAIPNVAFINADIIQATELQDPSMKASYRAAEIATQRRTHCLENGRSFISETVFSHPSKLDLIREAKTAGHNVVLYHVGVRSANISVDRVGLRVMKGGHPVPEDKIRARFERNQPLIREAATLSDRAFIYDNSVRGRRAQLGIEFYQGKVVNIGQNLQKWQRDLYGQDLVSFSAVRQNPAAASYEAASRMVQMITGDDKARAELPQKGQAYEGPLVGDTAMHYLQKTTTGDYVAHFKSVIGGQQRLNQPMTLTYASRRSATLTKGLASELGKPKRPPTLGR